MKCSSRIAAIMLGALLCIGACSATAVAASQTLRSTRYGFSVSLPDGWTGYTADQGGFGSMEISDGMTMEDMGLSFMAVSADGGMLMLMQFADESGLSGSYIDPDSDIFQAGLHLGLGQDYKLDGDVDSYTNAQTTYVVFSAEMAQRSAVQQMVMAMGSTQQRLAMLVYVPSGIGTLSQAKADFEAVLDTLVLTEATFDFPSMTDLARLGSQNLGGGNIDWGALGKPDSNAGTIWLVVGIVVGVLAIAAVAGGLLYSKRKKNQTNGSAPFTPDDPAQAAPSTNAAQIPVQTEAPQPDGQRRFCPQCGAKHEPGQAFCAHCGAKLQP